MQPIQLINPCITDSFHKKIHIYLNNNVDNTLIVMFILFILQYNNNNIYGDNVGTKYLTKTIMDSTVSPSYHIGTRRRCMASYWPMFPAYVYDRTFRTFWLSYNLTLDGKLCLRDDKNAALYLSSPYFTA